MKFALVLDGANAPTPAPRIDATESRSGTGIYSERDRKIWTANPADIMAALPHRYQRLHCRNPWHNDASRVNEAGNVKGDPPYCELTDTRNNRRYTVYLLPVYETAGAAA